MDGGEEELTAHETALYDRQIRVWGVDAQKRLSKAHVLVSGLNGATVEFCKNIVLAGVGSVTLMDDRLVSEEVLGANFLISLDEYANSNKSVAELCAESLRSFNPMVGVSFLSGDLSQMDGQFFDKFDVVVVCSFSQKDKILINETCRKRQKRIAFYTIDCRDSCGEIFTDLQNYTYMQKKGDERIERQLNYPSLEEAVLIPWKDLPRKVTKLFFAMRVLEKFELLEGRKPGETSLADLPSISKLRKDLCEAQGLKESHVADSLLERLLAAGKMEHPAVCAILGGILGQEVIKAISGKGDPLKNFFYIDAADGKGIIEDITVPDAVTA
ncbi:SUMO-activating enzyme subunit 1A [Rhynchospora pubera]|uniref:Ubiquitin-like 1-activating enzyme E1A n=1 Tax=Rhynchospora pubera TaxID=906938 RepID=A0AAV8C9V7_9POAL|nr:SUMO-activating enzyme subunit 1A [Rhynchospora pubera]